jgi:hypothetical protein
MLSLSILWCPAYTQTHQSEVYCLPIEKARLLVADAMRLRLVDSISNNKSARILLLEQEKESSYQSFTNLLKIEQEKNKIQSEIILHSESISEVYKEENTHLKKKVRNLKWQRAGLGVLVIVVTVLSL